MFFCGSVLAQVTVSGIVTDAATGTAVAYVNIGIRNKDIGTVSAADGSFSISIPPQYITDTLRFTMLGYSELRLPLAPIPAGGVFALTPLPVQLGETFVSATRPVVKKYGLTARPLLHITDASINQQDIFEIARLIDLGKARSHILSVNLLLNESDRDSGVFRINFYRYQNGRPGEKIGTRNILQQLPLAPGWLHFDLSAYDIYLSGQVVAAIEFLPPGKKDGRVVYEVRPGGRGRSFVRQSSLGTWQVPPAHYRMYVTASALDAGSTAAPEDEEQDLPPAFTLYSTRVQDSFSIFVRLPAGYGHDTSRHYPVVYVLDANVYFATLADSLDSAATPPVLVGIGYRDFVTMDSLRNRDDTYPIAVPSDSLPVSGGGARFYDFITTELQPRIEAMYRTRGQSRSIMGHSLGGYFVLYALYRDLLAAQPAFDNYVAASPSVDYHNCYLLQQFNDIETTSGHRPKRVHITNGTLEDDEADKGRYARLVDELVQVLSAPAFTGITLTHQVYPNAGHMETALASFYDGLRRLR